MENRRLSIVKVEKVFKSVQKGIHFCTDVGLRLGFEGFDSETYTSEQLSIQVKASWLQNHRLSIEKVEMCTFGKTALLKVRPKA